MVNRAGAHMLGYGDPSELVGRPVFDIVHPDDRALVVERIKRVMAGGGSGALVEERFLAKDGSFVPVEVVNSAFVWHGRPAVQVVVRDISRRVEAERSRRETDANYRAMVEGMGDGVAVHQQGTVVLMNRAGARMLGYDDPAAVEGMSVVGFLHPDQRDAMLERMRQVLAQGGIAPPAAASFRRKDGSYVQLEVANTVLSWQGQPAIQVVFRDVSERQRAEQELRASEERFRRLADASPDGIAVYQDGVVVLVNPAFVTALGYDSPDDALRHPAAEFVHEDDLPTVNTRSMELDGSATPGESLAVRFRRRDGTFVRAEVVGVSTTWQGRPAIQVMARFAARPRRDTA
jgi:PAS domain S-box-containing protein